MLGRGVGLLKLSRSEPCLGAGAGPGISQVVWSDGGSVASVCLNCKMSEVLPVHFSGHICIYLHGGVPREG